MAAKKVVTFGEIMLRLSTPGYQRFVQARQFDVHFGGAEANVAVALAQFGLDAHYVTRLPMNELGDAALNELKRSGVKTDYVVRGGDRVGIYFLETGASQRASRVIYDRSGSSTAGVQPGMVDWHEVFKDAAWFHFTGITPALSDSCAKTCREAAGHAKREGLTVSCDLNFRKKLWSQDKARPVMTELMNYVDVVIANEEDAEMVFGIKAEESDVSRGKVDVEGYTSVAKQLVEQFNLKIAAMTLRESLSASDNRWSGILHDGKSCCISEKYSIRIVDRVGGGDAFAAGLIFSLIERKAAKDALEFAVAASCLKHTIPGDFNYVSVGEVEALMREGGAGRVQR